MAIDDLVKEIVPYNPKPVWLHLYIWPFIILYACCLSTWSIGFGIGEHFEAGCIAMAIVGVLQILTVLFCQWFVGVRCWMTCTKATTPKDARLVKVVPTPNNGSAELVPLHIAKNTNGHKIIWFVFQKLKYIFDDEEQEFRSVTFPVTETVAFYQQAKGYEEDSALAVAKEHYGSNKMDMVIPTFSELFQERATAPFFVFQVFCVGLWCLEDYWYYSVFTLFMLVTFEATLVKQQLRNMAEIRNMGNKAYLINVYRARKWTKISTDDLLAGDIVSITRSKDENTLPCDILILRGTCIVDESMLTGESVLQMKEPIEDAEPEFRLDTEGDGKLFVLFGGTRVVQHSPPAKNSAGLKAPDNGCVGYVLRTGFNTSQGRLLRTILFGVKRVTANNKESFGFILFLLIFAIAASAYVWIKGSEDESRNKYKLFLECTLILTSVVPPELPIELSLAVNNSLLALQKLGVYCTEPFRIPFAGKVDICCFDKTGTLTTDNLIVEGVAGLGGSAEVGPLADAPIETVQVLASCHSLVQMEEEMVGDPLERVCLAAVDWVLTRNDTVIPKKGKQLPLRIIHRYHFSSAMKRMSVISGYIPAGTSDVHHLATVKGAPEVLKPMFIDAPDNYDQIYRKFTRQGARVLALGYRLLGQLSHQQVRDMSRDELERELHYAGFVIVSCPLKLDSKSVIKEIQNSSHQVVMITGDNPLTACHVARELRFTRSGSKTLILDHPAGSDWKWISVDNEIVLDVVPVRGELNSFIQKNDFCITGQAFAYLSETHPDFLGKLLPHVKVFARMAPKQKEYVITSLKRLGHVTLMCGDGTNDVGALKHADVGVALLSHPLIEKPKPKESDQNEVNGPKKDSHAGGAGSPSSSTKSTGPPALPASARRRMPPGKREDARAAANVAQMTATQKKLQQIMKELEEEEKAQVVRLGDASVAAPFTSKYSSIQSTCHVIKQGRCTLVTTLQMFKILALNALVLAYSQSVLYLDGIKFSDTQATVQGLLLAACFLFISRSKPLKTLSRQRPLTNIFNAYTLLTVTTQFAVHFVCLVFLVREAHALSPPKEGKVDLEKEFKPNILNTTVYILSVALQISTFAVNYRGRPFMESLLENKALAYSLLFTSTSILTLASGMAPDLTEKFELVVLPTEHRNTVLCVLAADMLGCLIVDRVLQFLLGDYRVRGNSKVADD